MAPRSTRADGDPPELREIILSNIPDQGLGYYDKNSKLVRVSDVNLQLIGTTFSPKFGIKANIWAAKYNLAAGQKIWRLVVPKALQKDPNKFEALIDRQSGEDSGFRIRKNSLWLKFIQHQEDRLHESGNRVRFTLAESTGLQDQIVSWHTDRESERYVFNSNMMLDHRGKKLSRIDCVFFAQLSTQKDAMPLLKGISLLPGGRDVFAEVIRVSTPDNFYPCQLALAGGFGLFHGMLIRRVTSGQLPVLCLKSLQRGKSQGKSGVGRLIMKCVSDWTRNKISHRLNIETIKKRSSFTTLPLYFDDVKTDKFLAKISEGYDDGEVYETREGEFVRKAEMIFSANYFGMDEDTAAVDGERILDRIAVIPFDEWGEISANEFASKQKRFKQVVDKPDKPTEYLIGDIGDFIRSQEFHDKKEEFAEILTMKCEETIKPRTASNYSPFYAIVWKFHEDFKNVWEDMGMSWDGFMDWVETSHAPFLQKQHQEKDHSKHSIRRYILEVLSFTLEWSILERRKILKICETKKLKNSEKFCLAFHPSPRFVDFQEMGGVRLKDLKAHTNAVGGAWGDDTWAAMVKDNCDAVLDATDDEGAGLEDTVAKRALLIPIRAFTSTHIMKIASMTGQSDDYQKFGVDEETPSGVLDFRNSTQRSGSSFNLVLTDVSRIQPIEEEVINFEELPKPAEENFLEDFVDDEEDIDETQNDVYEERELQEDDEDDDMSLTCNDDIDFNLTNKKKPNLSKSMKSRNITVIERHDKTFFVCHCGFSSTSQSGSSRHKCRKTTDVAFACKDCGQVCRNPGSLKRHCSAKHKQSESLKAAEVFMCGVCADVFHSKTDLEGHKLTTHKHSVSLPTPSKPKSISLFCEPCGKKFRSKKTFETHAQLVHRSQAALVEDEAEDTLEEIKCATCGISCENKNTLDAHMQTHVDDSASTVPDASPLTGSEETRLTCSVCAKSLKNNKTLKRHMKTHPDIASGSFNEIQLEDVGSGPAVSALTTPGSASVSSSSSNVDRGRRETRNRRRSLSVHKSKTSARRK